MYIELNNPDIIYKCLFISIKYNFDERIDDVLEELGKQFLQFLPEGKSLEDFVAIDLFFA